MKRFTKFVIGVVLIIGLAYVCSLMPWTAWKWHLRHGSNVSYQGITFRLPSDWMEDSSLRRADELSLAKDGGIGLFSKPVGLLNVRVKGFGPNETWAQDTATKWQTFLVSQQVGQPEILQGRKYSMICVTDRLFADTYDKACAVVGTGLMVSITGDSQGAHEAEEILETSL